MLYVQIIVSVFLFIDKTGIKTEKKKATAKKNYLKIWFKKLGWKSSIMFDETQVNFSYFEVRSKVVRIQWTTKKALNHNLCLFFFFPFSSNDLTIEYGNDMLVRVLRAKKKKSKEQ